jgi:Xaa-Pro dipeptidase
MITPAEIERRFKNIRTAMAAASVDGLLVCGNQYSGFEGAARYVSGFEIVHRYVYVLIPLAGDPILVFPKEARWIGDKKKPWVKEHVWPDVPGKWIREHAEAKHWKRLAVYGLDYIMTVRDYRELQPGNYDLVPFDFQFDMARAIKSQEELRHVREAMNIIEDGFWKLVAAYEPGKTEAAILAPAVEVFFERGAGPRMMNIVLSGSGGESEAHFKVPGHRVVGPEDLMLYSLEITDIEGYWVELSRPLIRGKVSARTAAMMKPYPDAIEAARVLMREGEPVKNVHKAAADIFAKHGFTLGHLSGHSIGLTMLEHPSIGANSDVELRENMVVSFHPQVIDPEGTLCLYTQDTYRVGKKEGECLANLPWRLYHGGEAKNLASKA